MIREVHPNQPRPTAKELETLTAAMEKETRLLQTLVAKLEEQRAAIAGGDTRSLDAQLGGLSTILAEMESARSERQAWMNTFTGNERHALSDLEHFIRGPLPAPFASARKELRQAGHEAAGQIAINGAVLRRAVAGGAEFLHSILTQLVETDRSYAPATGARDGAGRPVLIDKVG